MQTKKKIIVATIVGLCLICSAYLINSIYSNRSVTQITQSNEVEVTTTEVQQDTTINVNERETKTSKKTKKTKKKTTKKTTKKINIKYNKQEIINYTYQRVVARFGEDHWQAVYNIISHESGFNPNDVNKKSGACGLFQAKPCNKTIKNGYKDYYTNWKMQVEWGLDYIQIRYKTPNNAWKFWQKHHWY